MANYDRRRYQDRDWSDENNFRNRNMGYDRDENDADFYRQYRGRGSNSDYGYDRDYGYSGRDYSDRGFRAGGNADFYGRDRGSWSGSDLDRDYDRGYRGGSNPDYYGRNRGWGSSDYDRDYGYGYEGRGSSSMSGSNYQGRNMGSQSDWDYDRSMGGNPYGNQGRGSGYDRQMGNQFGNQGQSSRSQSSDWGEPGYNQGRNQGYDWTYNRGNMQNERQGQYYGRGPQGYNRSDDRIKEDVNDRLTWHGNVDATNIQVNVKDGEVTLEGTVSDRYQKRMAEEAAEQIQGVKDVQNRLRVQNDMGDMNQSSSGSSSKRSGSSSQSGSSSSSTSQVPNGKPKERANS